MILIPANGDNTAIALRRIERNEPIRALNSVASDTVLDGHRVAAQPIRAGDLLLSWNLPFGRALRDIARGEYLRNARIIQTLRQRQIDFKVPTDANFEDYRAEFHLDEKNFRPGAQVPLHAESPIFSGYRRSDGQVGTRNYIIILATTSLANTVARAIAAQFSEKHFNFDGIVAVTHTEGAGPNRPNNFDIVVRTLRGFINHPNVAAFVAIDQGSEPINNELLKPAAHRPHAFISIGENFESSVARGAEKVRELLPAAIAIQRTKSAAADLKFGLQCGGSDAFSGVSGNPLVGWLAREVVRCGGSANLAETDELIGAESYVLANVRDLDTARAFLQKRDEFQQRAAWHGHSAEGNPSGGNLFRGLYNITIKSIGAALKKTADTRLDYVIGYGEPMPAPGFYFMDSPGNDLESIAGQVASGCNMILFATGNGSITNFPFVPTIKVMTTTQRFELLRREMDFNAGRFLDGEPMDALGAEAFDLCLEVALGMRTAGEEAGHAQTQIWRDWKQTGPNASLELPKPTCIAINSRKSSPYQNETIPAFHVAKNWTLNPISLIVPTSLCAGQIALMLAEAVTRRGAPCVALPHTEGCGNSGGESERLMLRTLAGYAIHPSAQRVLMLEHGCEKTHNDAFRQQLPPEAISRLGWGSIQLDGGIESTIQKGLAFFSTRRPPLRREPAPISALRLGMVSADGPLPDFLRELAEDLANAGALVVIPGEPATIDYGQPAPSHGLHQMRAPTDHYIEILTGLGATGVELILAWIDGPPAAAHPFIPTIELNPQKAKTAREAFELLKRALSSEPQPPPRHADFQITRGLEGVSL